MTNEQAIEKAKSRLSMCDYQPEMLNNMTDEEAFGIIFNMMPEDENEGKALSADLSALRERIACQNPQPLTLDELREMDGEPQPVYLVSERYEEGNGWKICHGMNDNGMINFGDEAWAVQVFDEGYVKGYRTKPEQEVRNREA